MRSRQGIQPRWGRAVGAVIAVVIALAFIRGVVEAILMTGVIGVLVVAYFIRRKARADLIYHGDSRSTSAVTSDETRPDDTGRRRQTSGHDGGETTSEYRARADALGPPR